MRGTPGGQVVNNPFEWADLHAAIREQQAVQAALGDHARGPRFFTTALEVLSQLHHRTQVIRVFGNVQLGGCRRCTHGVQHARNGVHDDNENDPNHPPAMSQRVDVGDVDVLPLGAPG